MEKQACPETSNVSPVKAIRMKCIDCSGGSKSEVDKCHLVNCPLHPFRYGRNPFRKEISEEERARRAEIARRNFGKQKLM